MEIEVATSQEDVQQVLLSAQKVIQIPMLFDKIIDFAMYEGGNVQIKTAKAFKLVSKLWLEKVSDSLWRSRPSEYHVKFYPNNTTRIPDFVNTFKTLPFNRILPYTLNSIYFDGLLLNSEYLFNSLNCLFWVGQGLRKINLVINCDLNGQERFMGFQNIPVANLYLPQLEEVVIGIDCAEDKDGCIGTHGSILTFLRSVFAGSEAIRRFRLNQFSFGFKSSDFLPEIPKSVTDVGFDCEFSPGHLARMLLGNNSLPNLTSLLLRIPETRFDITNELASILSHYRQQLKNLDIKSRLGTPSRGPQTTIVMPVMESLLKLTVSADNYVWPDTQNFHFPQYFPKLKEIFFRNQTINNVCKWLRRLRCPLVEKVKVWQTVGYVDTEELPLEQAHLLKTAFPSITTLWLEIEYTPQMSHLKVIFHELRQLQHLSIEVIDFDSDIPNDLSHHFFNALLIGVTQEDAAALEEQRNDSNKRNIECRDFPSLVQMTELVSLKLSTYKEEHSKLISDVAFEYAFLRLPKLRKLELSGRFKPSPEMEQHWKEHCHNLQAMEKDN